MLRHVGKRDSHGEPIYCNVDENGVEQGPFEIHYYGTRILKGYYKDGKKDGPVKFYANENDLISEHVFRDGVELFDQEAKDYLCEWKERQKKEKERKREEEKRQSDITLLTEEQVWGDEDGDGQLDVIKKYGKTAAPTDLAVLLGTPMTTTGTIDGRTSEGDLTCFYYTSSPYEGGSAVRTVSINGNKNGCIPYVKEAVRPVIPPGKTIELLPMSEKKGINDVDIVEYGEYPQTVVDEETAGMLMESFQKHELTETGKVYWLGGPSSEYECDGEKYVLVTSKPYNEENQLSSGEKVKKDKPYWVRVEPIEWLADKSGFWVAKKALISGIEFSYRDNYDGIFSKTNMCKYLKEHFSEEITPSEKDIRRVKMLKGLGKKLAEISDLEKVKRTVMPARTPERTEILARIMRVRKAKGILSSAAQKAHQEGDKKTLREIVKLAKPYAAREAAIRNKFNLKRAERRAKKSRG